MMIDDFHEYLQKAGHTDATIESCIGIVNKFLVWCNRMDHDIHQINYEKCMDYFELLLNKRTKTRDRLKKTTIRSYTGVIKLFFKYLVNEDVFTVSPIEQYKYTTKKRYTYNTLLSSRELELLYICYPTIDIKPPKCKSVAIRNKVITGLVVFQGLDTRILKHLRVSDIDLNRRKIHVPGTRRSEPKVYDLRLEQMDVLRQYLHEDRTLLQRKINCYSGALFPLNSDRFSIISNQVTKVLKTINYRVMNFQQIRASVIAQWVQDDNLRVAQNKSRHRFISSTNEYTKYNPKTSRRAADEFHVMR